MKSLLLAVMMSAASATAGYAGQYWVAGNRSTGKCDIVTSQPVTYGLPGYNGAGGEYSTWFTSGPYKSLDDAKLARSTIRACPPPDPDDKQE